MSVYKPREARYPRWPAARDILPDDSFGDVRGRRKTMPHKPIRYDVQVFDAVDIDKPIPYEDRKPVTTHTIKRNVSRAEALRIIDRMNRRHKRLVYSAESNSHIPTRQVEYR